MSDDDWIIKADNLSKSYKLYPSQGKKILDMMGLLRRSDSYPVRHALRDVNLTIQKGERVSIIGRNGAGKSTLLKLISEVIRPTSGSVHVKGTAKALLEIGSGFYIDLSGRDNVIGYLVQQGIREKAIRNYMNDIIEFAEIEDYIDQPVKTYSSGMRARLMFAASTSITPDLLILDEILSVGDAYFTQKCIDRVTQLCNKDETTLLLVSHDIYSAAKLANRMIWIDEGRIEYDGKPKDIVEIYESSVCLQEEKRLRKKCQNQLKAKTLNHTEPVILEFYPQDFNALPGNILFHSLMLIFDDTQIMIPLIEYARQDKGIIFEDGCWGDIKSYHQRSARVMKNHGSTNFKVGVYCHLTAAEIMALKAGKGKLELVVAAAFNFNLHLAGFISDQTYYFGVVSYLDQPDWKTIKHSLRIVENKLDLNAKYKSIGSNSIAICQVEVTNQTRGSTHLIKSGEPLTIKLLLEVNDKSVSAIDIVITLLKDGVNAICRYYKKNLALTSDDQVTLSVDIDHLGLGEGEYTIAAMITKAGYIDSPANKFYSINPDVYYSGRDLYTLKVLPANFVEQNTAYIAQAEWQVSTSRNIHECDVIAYHMNS